MNKLLKLSLLGLLLVITPSLRAQKSITQELSPLDSLMRRIGLVDVRELDPSIRVELRYSSRNNFIGEDMYGTLERAYLEPSFARRIAQAQRKLKAIHPEYRLLIYDAARPMSVQAKMYARVANTPLKIYVAPARRGGRHNYGVAVDLTIVDEHLNPLDMGTDFDHFGEAAHVGDEPERVRQGKLSPAAAQNRALLYSIMKSVGLRPYDKEWWHYQEMIPMSEVRKRYRLINDL